MRKSDLLSAAWLVLALLGILSIGTRGTTTQQVAAQQRGRPTLAAGAMYKKTPRGEPGVVDANGFVIPVRAYQRIAAASTIADALVLALVEPERIHALTEYGHVHSDAAHLYGARLLLSGVTQQVEQLVSERVDLMLVNHVRSQSELARIREAGIQVFNLGEMRGMQTLLPNIAAVAALIGEPERGRVYSEKLRRRLQAVASDIPLERRKRALYVSAYGNQLYGGTGGTSYHDALVFGGLIDVTEGKLEGFPRYDPEQLLELDPERIVVNEGTQEALCRVGGLEALRACQHGRAGLVGVPTTLIGDPGPGMLEAAEFLRAAVYGDGPRP